MIINLNIKWICIGSGIILLLAIPTGLPYSYYVFLRFAIFISSIILAYKLYNSNIPIWAFLFGFIALTFNPLIPITLNKQLWISIDFMVMLLFFLTPKYILKEKCLLKRKDKFLYGFAIIGYLLALLYSSNIGYALLGAFIGGWIAVFFITYILKE